MAARRDGDPDDDDWGPRATEELFMDKLPSDSEEPVKQFLQTLQEEDPTQQILWQMALSSLWDYGLGLCVLNQLRGLGSLAGVRQPEVHSLV